MKREGSSVSGMDHEAERIAAEFLRAQEVRRPSTVEELREATESANDMVERVLFQRDRWRAMKGEDADGREDGEASDGARRPESLYDEWIDVMLDLEEAFIDEHEGALGKRVLELLALDDVAFVSHVAEARSILQQTTPMALRVYPFTHRLVDLGVGGSRAEVVERLSSGDLVKQEKIHNVSVTPKRRTIVGLLRDLDARLLAEEQTDIWSLEVAPELPATAVISDPFQSGNEDLSAYWRNKIAIEHEMHKESASILSLSGDKTTAVIYELQDIAERAKDDVLRAAAETVATWLEGKHIYYQDPDPRDFELYHLGMEEPHQLMDLMRSLDVIKHFDPELFFELLGIDPAQGGRSMYFGSFLHKALFNTQRTVNHVAPELGEMAIRTMLNQLLTVNDQVQTYAAVVSQESLKAMAGEVKKTVEAAPTTSSKAQTFMMMAVPYSRMAIDAEVRRQLDALREASPENVVEELRRRIDDIEHPLKLAEYLRTLPQDAHHDIRVRHLLLKILPPGMIENGSYCKTTNFNRYSDDPTHSKPLYLSKVISYLYDRIPLIDETREDLGFGLRVRIALRDALSFADTAEEILEPNTSERTRARQFLKSVMWVNLFREDFEAIQDQFGPFDRRVAARFSYGSLAYYDFDTSHENGLLLRSLEVIGSEKDRAFHLGQVLINFEMDPKDREKDFLSDLFTYMMDKNSDLVFLSIVAHPQGKNVAFKYFHKFCDMIPAERMCEMLKHQSQRMWEFLLMFSCSENDKRHSVFQYTITNLPYGRGLALRNSWQLFTHHLQDRHVETLKMANQILLEKESPWTEEFEVFVIESDRDGRARTERRVKIRVDYFELDRRSPRPMDLKQFGDMWGIRPERVGYSTRTWSPDSLVDLIYRQKGYQMNHTGPDFIRDYINELLRKNM